MKPSYFSILILILYGASAYVSDLERYMSHPKVKAFEVDIWDPEKTVNSLYGSIFDQICDWLFFHLTPRLASNEDVMLNMAEDFGYGAMCPTCKLAAWMFGAYDNSITTRVATEALVGICNIGMPIVGQFSGKVCRGIVT